MQRSQSLCKALGLDTWFQVFPSGYEEKVGESGMPLSGGQRQLVALARALYQKPKLLFLDEATAAMDKEMEQFVFALLKKINKHTAILFITHQTELTKHADVIYHVENKQVFQISCAEVM